MNNKKILGVPQMNKVQLGAILFGLFLALFANCDTSIISTASVTMLADIGNEKLYTLLLSSKMITTIIACLIGGKMSDKFGRRNILLVGISVVIITNLASGLSSNMLQLLIARAVFGLGMGFIVTGCNIIMGEVMAERSGYAFIVNLLAYGIAYVTAPLITAGMIEYFSWKMAFIVYIPVSFAAFLIVLFFCPDYRMEKSSTKIDIKGIVQVAVSLIIFVTTLALAGSYLPWSSPITIGLLIVGVMLFACFIYHEKQIEQNIAILPVSLLKSKLIIGCAAGQLAMTINSTCLLTYIPYYMQSEMGATPAQAGLVFSINYAITTIIGSFMLVLMVKKQNHRTFGIITVVGESVALSLIYLLLSPQISLILLYLLLCLYGVSQSVESYAFVMTSQMGLTKSKLAVGTALITFVQNFAGVAGTSISGSIVNSSSNIGEGIRNVFLFAAIITVIGAIVFATCVPKTSKIKEMVAEAQRLEDGRMTEQSV